MARKWNEAWRKKAGADSVLRNFKQALSAWQYSSPPCVSGAAFVDVAQTAGEENSQNREKTLQNGQKTP